MKKRRDKLDLADVMNILTVVVAIIVCVGLTVLHLYFQYDGNFAKAFSKINVTLTGILFADIVAFAFLGVLIMYGIKKLVLAKAKKK